MGHVLGGRNSLLIRPIAGYSPNSLK